MSPSLLSCKPVPPELLSCQPTCPNSSATSLCPPWPQLPQDLPGTHGMHGPLHREAPQETQLKNTCTLSGSCEHSAAAASLLLGNAKLALTGKRGYTLWLQVVQEKERDAQSTWGVRWPGPWLRAPHVAGSTCCAVPHCIGGPAAAAAAFAGSWAPRCCSAGRVFAGIGLGAGAGP